MRELLDASELERVEPSADVANRLLLDAKQQHVASAEAVVAAGDVSGAYSLAYDALRKSATSYTTDGKWRSMAVSHGQSKQLLTCVFAFRR